MTTTATGSLVFTLSPDSLKYLALPLDLGSFDASGELQERPA